MTKEEQKKEIKERIKNLESLLKDTRVTSLSNIKDKVAIELSYAKKELDSLNTNITFSKMIGKYYKYHDSHSVIDRIQTIYMYIRNVKNCTLVCDIISHTNWKAHPETHIYENTTRDCDYLDIVDFKEITRDEFIKKYNELCSNALTILKENKTKQLINNSI